MKVYILNDIIAKFGAEIGELYLSGFFAEYSKIKNGSITVHRGNGILRKLEVREIKNVDNL